MQAGGTGHSQSCDLTTAAKAGIVHIPDGATESRALTLLIGVKDVGNLR